MKEILAYSTVYSSTLFGYFCSSVSIFCYLLHNFYYVYSIVTLQIQVIQNLQVVNCDVLPLRWCFRWDIV